MEGGGWRAESNLAPAQEADPPTPSHLQPVLVGGGAEQLGLPPPASQLMPEQIGVWRMVFGLGQERPPTWPAHHFRPPQLGPPTSDHPQLADKFWRLLMTHARGVAHLHPAPNVVGRYMMYAQYANYAIYAMLEGVCSVPSVQKRYMLYVRYVIYAIYAMYRGVPSLYMDMCIVEGV